MTPATKPRLTRGTRIEVKDRPLPFGTRTRRGGAGRVTHITWDAQGLVYTVELDDGRIQCARPEHLRLPRVPTKTRRTARRAGAGVAP